MYQKMIHLLLVVLLPTVISASRCDPTWHYYNETGCCYKTTSEAGTWFQGTSMCSRLRAGAQMASLRSQNESRFVASKYFNGIDGIHAWTGLSQTQVANNWTFTDGSRPFTWFLTPYFYLHNHTSCVEIVDNWLVSLFNNSGKTQPTFCFNYLKSLCKYCPAPATTTTTTTTTTRTTTTPTTTTTARTTSTTTTTPRIALVVNPVKLVEKTHPRKELPLSSCLGISSAEDNRMVRNMSAPRSTTVLPNHNQTNQKVSNVTTLNRTHSGEVPRGSRNSTAPGNTTIIITTTSTHRNSGQPEQVNTREVVVRNSSSINTDRNQSGNPTTNSTTVSIHRNHSDSTWKSGNPGNRNHVSASNATTPLRNQTSRNSTINSAIVSIHRNHSEGVHVRNSSVLTSERSVVKNNTTGNPGRHNHTSTLNETTTFATHGSQLPSGHSTLNPRNSSTLHTAESGNHNQTSTSNATTSAAHENQSHVVHHDHQLVSGNSTIHTRNSSTLHTSDTRRDRNQTSLTPGNSTIISGAAPIHRNRSEGIVVKNSTYGHPGNQNHTSTSNATTTFAVHDHHLAHGNSTINPRNSSTLPTDINQKPRNHTYVSNITVSSTQPNHTIISTSIPVHRNQSGEVFASNSTTTFAALGNHSEVASGNSRNHSGEAGNLRFSNITTLRAAHDRNTKSDVHSTTTLPTHRNTTTTTTTVSSRG